MKRVSLLCFTGIILLLSGCGSTSQLQQYPEQRLHITVMHTADIRGVLTGETGSFARAAGVIEEIREQREHTVLIDTGNLAGGSSEAYLSGLQLTQHSHIQAALLRNSRYDAALLGSRELGYSTAVYQRIRQDSQVPWVGANIINRSTGASHVTPYRIIERGSARIALLGLTHPAARSFIPERLIPGIDVLDLEDQAKYWVPRILEQERPDILILAIHAGDDTLFRHTLDAQQSVDGTYRELIERIARQVEGIDAVLTNVDYRGFDLILQGADGRQVFVINPADRGREVGLLELELFRPRGSAVFTEITITQERRSTEHAAFSDSVLELLIPYRQRLEAYLERPLAESDAPLTTRDAFFFDAPLMELIHRVQRSVTNAHVSFASPPALDLTLEAGTLRSGDIFALLPHESFLVSLRMTGAEIARYLEYSYAQWFSPMTGPYDHLVRFDAVNSSDIPSLWHRFDTAGGLNYTYDAARPLGDRIRISGFTNGRPFRRDETYIAALNSYRAAGGGGHLTEGVGLSPEEISRRMVFTSIRDLKHQVMTWLEREQRFIPREEPSWYVVPEAWGAAGYLNDYPRLFGDTPKLR